MDAVTILLRFIFGVVLAGGLVLWGGMPFLASVLCVVSAGIIAAIWGDKFLQSLMSIMRYFR